VTTKKRKFDDILAVVADISNTHATNTIFLL